MINLVLENKEEAQILVNLIDIAVRSKGLEAAEAGIYFTKKIKQAVEEPEEVPKKTTDEPKTTDI